MKSQIINLIETFESEVKSINAGYSSNRFKEPSLDMWIRFHTFFLKIVNLLPAFDENNEENYLNIRILEILAKNRIFIDIKKPFEDTKKVLLDYCSTIIKSIQEIA